MGALGASPVMWAQEVRCCVLVLYQEKPLEETPPSSPPDDTLVLRERPS